MSDKAKTEPELPTQLLWVDLEMTGLDPYTQRIIEVAAIVTDFEFNEVAKYEAIIHQEEDVLEKAEDWPKANMQKLFKEVRKSKTSEEQVVTDLLDLIHDHFPEEAVILAGNSIHNDRRFIRNWWPNIEGHLHYRMLDVSTFKIWLQGTKGVSFEKSEEHRALGDIRESISELKWCLEQLKT